MQKLYHGTTEIIAKSAPLVGIKPYSVPHHEDEIVFSDPITLTTCYGAYQAFMSCDPKKSERWAIVEVLPHRLRQEALGPYPGLKLRGKNVLQKSLDMVGLCTYSGVIPAVAIGKVWIFNPESNWIITRTVLHTVIGVEPHSEQQKSMEVINRWLTGEFVLIDAWLAQQKEEFTKEQKDQMSNLWAERSGLDLFYHGSREERR